jgi:predicted ATP-binding protein involved in virulence
MRLNRIIVRNFKGFEDQTFNLSSQFNLIVGSNGAGKTSALDAISVAIGAWLLGLRGYDTRHIKSEEVRLAEHRFRDELRFEAQFPVEVDAEGQIGGSTISWRRAKHSLRGKTLFKDAREVKAAATSAEESARAGEEVLLPLISYYGTGRLWQEPRAESKVPAPYRLAKKEKLSRLEAYRNSVSPKLSTRELVQWIARQSWIGYQEGRDSPLFVAVRTAILQCVEGAEHLYFDPKRGEVVVRIQGQGAQPFANLSDGQRCMLALVGDIAQKAATLNPHLGEEALARTPGVVLIDELDLHLHPRWQRRVIEDLRVTFPSIQFICTTHSPFLIQSLREGEELLSLDYQGVADFERMPITEILRGVMGVPNSDVSARYEEMVGVAKNFLRELQAADLSSRDRLEQFKRELARASEPYADNPAFQAYLELKLEAKRGASSEAG